MHEQLTCRYCDKPLKIQPGRGFSRRRFCDDICRRRSKGLPDRNTPRTPPVELICERCGTPFTVNAYRATRTNRRFCTDECRRAGPLSDPMERLLAPAIRDDNGCLNRPRAFWDGQRLGVASRMAWQLTHNVTLPAETKVCHHCDNPTCIEISHLFLGTQGDNLRDMDAQGRRRPAGAKGSRNSHAKIAESDIPEVLGRIHQGDSDVAIAADYGVVPQTIWKIRRGENWPHLTGIARHPGKPHGKLTDTQRNAILARYAQGGIRQVDLAQEFGVHQTAISKLLRK